MPRNCADCPMGRNVSRIDNRPSNHGYCCISCAFPSGVVVPSDCPIVPVPSYEELLKAAKAMHTWIFLNSYDEQEAFGECGLSDEMNAVLGYAGSFILAEEGEA